MMAPQFVKPYVMSNKNDRNDVQGISEAEYMTASQPLFCITVNLTLDTRAGSIHDVGSYKKFTKKPILPVGWAEKPSAPLPHQKIIFLKHSPCGSINKELVSLHRSMNA